MDDHVIPRFDESGKLRNVWEVPGDEILAQMEAKPGWWHFGEYDNTSAVMGLVRSGKIELDPDWNNRISGMVTSLRARVAIRA